MVVGVLAADDRVLIAQRPANRPHAGSWEFPGGKLEADESGYLGLVRELREELGITVEAARPLISIRHRYPDRNVHLDVWRVDRYRGQPRGLEGQALCWRKIKDLAATPLLPADRPIITALRLPERITQARTAEYELTAFGASRQPAGAADILHGEAVATMAQAMLAAGRGADFLVLLPGHSREKIATLCDGVPIPVYVSGMPLADAWDLGASGIAELDAPTVTR